MKRLFISALFLCFVAFVAVVIIFGPHFIESVTKPAQDTKAVQETKPVQNYDKNIQLKISTDKDTYYPGDIVNITASVENTSSISIDYHLGNIGDPTPYIYLESNSYFHGFLLEENGVPRLVLTLPTSGQLKPNSVVTRQVIWNQMFYSKEQAPQGTYQITCWLTLEGDRNGSSLKTLKVSKDIILKGSLVYITPDQAQNIALSLPAVQAWRESHSGKNVIKQENGQYYLMYDGEWQKIAPQFSGNEQRMPLTVDNHNEWMPDVTTIFENSQYIITMGTKVGPNPHFVKIQIDPVTGSIIELKLTDKP
jgi:hypothetical protein